MGDYKQSEYNATTHKPKNWLGTPWLGHSREKMALTEGFQSVGRDLALGDGLETRLLVNHDPPGTTATLPDGAADAIGDTVVLAYRVTTPEY